MCFLRRTLPEKTIVAVAIPFNKQQFDTLFDRGDSDFIRSLTKVYKTEDKTVLWDKYSITADYVRTNLTHFAKRGAMIIEELTTRQLQRIADADIAIIIAHHSDIKDEIEMADGMVPATDFVNAIPTAFTGLLDLSSCFSSTIQLSIKMCRPNCHVLAVRDKISLHKRITTYDFIFKEMSLPSSRKRIQEQLNAPSEKQLSLMDMEPYMREYLEIVKSAYAIILRERSRDNVRVNPEVVFLGGSVQSSVFAPKQVKKGQPFLIQVAIHKAADADRVEIAAREADGSTSLRNPLRLSFKVKKGDRVDIALKINSTQKDDFKISRSQDSFDWNNEPRFTNFTVLVSEQCKSQSCMATIKICINKLPVGDISFNSEVVDSITQKDAAAEINFMAYNKQQEMKEAQATMMLRLKQELDSLLEGTTDKENTCLQRDIEICKNSIELLESTDARQKHNQIFKVFISSTSDMAPYRKAMEKQVLDCSMYPEMYEKWPQKDKYPRDYCIEKVLGSDIFVCILGPNYGFIEPNLRTSMTEIEFRVALLSGKPILVYVLDDYERKMLDYLPEHQYEVDKQRDFINELDSKRMVEFFKDEFALSLLSSRELTLIQTELTHQPN